MFRICLVLVLGGVLAGRLPAAPVDPLIAKEVAAAFARAAQEHESIHVPYGNQTLQQPAPSRAPEQPAFKPWSLLHGGADNTVLNYSTAMEKLIARVAALDAAGKAEKVAGYCRAAMPFLAARRKADRALACEFLAHFPATAVECGAAPGIGALLDDAAVAFPAMHQSLPQQGPTANTPGAMTVAGVAQVALLHMTGGRFANRAIFRRWWAANDGYADRLWYWATRYRDTAEARARLEKLDPNRVLKIYLLLNNATARRNEMTAPWREAGLQAPADFDGGIYLYNQPNMAWVGKYVAAHRLQPVLFDLLAGRTAWPEVKDNTGWGETALALVITEVGRHCWARADAATIEAILNGGRGLAVHENRVQTGLAEVAVTLDGARLEPILLGQLARNPRQPELAAVLLANTGLKHWPLIRKYYDGFDGDGQCQVIRTLGNMAIRPEMRATLCRLFAEDQLDAAMTADGRVADADGPRRARLSAYAGAAERLNGGRPAVEPAVLRDALSTGDGKIDNATRAAQRAALPEARREAIRQLAAFYAKITPTD